MLAIRLAESVKSWKWVFGFLAGLLLGAGGGGYGTWRHLNLRPSVQGRVVYDGNEDPGEWLMPPGVTLQDLFPDESLREAILHPDSIRIHQIGGDEGLLVDNKWAFSSVGVVPDEKVAERLVHALGSMTSYRTPSACEFSPGVLLKLEKAGKVYEFVFCFSCGDVRFSDRGEVGMTEEGRKAFIWYFSDALPGFAKLQELRAQYD